MENNFVQRKLQFRGHMKLLSSGLILYYDCQKIANQCGLIEREITLA